MPQHDGNNRDTEPDENNSKRAKRPPEVDIRVEQLRDPGACERRGDGGRPVDTNDQHTVPERRHVGEHDVDDVEKSDVANPINGVGSSVGLDVLAGGLHDAADDVEDEESDEARVAAPNVDDLSDGELAGAAEDGGDDADGGEEAVLAELGGDVGVEVALDRDEEHVAEGDEVQPREERVVSLMIRLSLGDRGE